MTESVEISFNPKYISAQLAEALAQAIGQWISEQRGEKTLPPMNSGDEEPPHERQISP